MKREALSTAFSTPGSRSRREARYTPCIGPNALDTMRGLRRRGFAHVPGLRGGEARGVAESGDHLFVGGGPLPGARLAEVIADGSCHLGGGGVLIARLTGVDQARALEACLTRAGFEGCSTVYDLSRDILVSHRLARFVNGSTALARAASTRTTPTPNQSPPRRF